MFDRYSPNTLPVILNDSPAIDLFEPFQFSDFLNALYYRLVNPLNSTPLTISIEGDWGYGKTTLMKHLKTRLDFDANLEERVEGFRICRTVWFQVWKYYEQDEILSALIQTILNEMRKNSKFESLIASVFENNIVSNIVKNIFQSFNVAGISPFSNIGQSKHKANLAYYYHFSNFLKLLIKLYTHQIEVGNFKDAIENVSKLYEYIKDDDVVVKDRQILVLFIDDLDRCSKEKIVKILDCIKLFLDFPGIAIIIGMSPSIISTAIEDIKKEPALQYLEKMIQLRCAIPAYLPDTLKKYGMSKKNVGINFSEFAFPQKYDIPEIISYFSDTPRQFKQYSNNIYFLFSTLTKRKILEENHNLNIEKSPELKELILNNRKIYKHLMFMDSESKTIFLRFLETGILSDTSNRHVNYYLYTLCKEENEIKKRLKAIADLAKFEKQNIRENPTLLHFLLFYLWKEKINRCFQNDYAPKQFDYPIHFYLEDIEFWKDFQRGNLDVDLIINDDHRKIFDFIKIQLRKIQFFGNNFEDFILELPVDDNNLSLLIKQGIEPIPESKSQEAASKANHKYKEGIDEKYEELEKINDQFFMDRFLVTNSRFKKFIEYLLNNDKEKEIPEYLLLSCSKLLIEKENKCHVRRGFENHPVTGVTWNGATAFAKWDNGKTLPTRKQWLIAFGDRKYAFGNEFDNFKCNTYDSQILSTTQVDNYFDGVSPFNIFDMSGNVWEWCLDGPNGETGFRYIMGGSWANRKEDASKTCKESHPKERSIASIGFRCVKNLT